MNLKHGYWCVCGGVAVLGLGAACLSAWFTFTINLTHSLPGTLYVIHKGAAVGKGDLVAFRWHGGATYPTGAIFIKRVAGMPGERVTVAGDHVWVGAHEIGIAKPVSRAGVPLSPTAGGIIQPGTVFVATPHPDSLDSRYALTGNIHHDAIIGRTYVLF